MAIILNINKDLSIKKITHNYKIISKGNLFSKEEQKKIISEYVFRDDYRDSLNIKKELAEKYVGKDQDTNGTEIIDGIIKGFNLTFLEDYKFLEDQFGSGFVCGITEELKKRHDELGDYSYNLSGSYLIRIAQDVGFKDYLQYQRQSTSEKKLEGIVEK